MRDELLPSDTPSVPGAQPQTGAAHGGHDHAEGLEDLMPRVNRASDPGTMIWQLIASTAPGGSSFCPGWPAGANLVWKDTVLVRAGQTVDITLDVRNPGLWMAYRHIAEHDQSG